MKTLQEDKVDELEIMLDQVENLGVILDQIHTAAHSLNACLNTVELTPDIRLAFLLLDTIESKAGEVSKVLNF